MKILNLLTWDGSLPGYGDATRTFSAISLPHRQQMCFRDGSTVALPERSNDVRVSEGGQWAWIGQDSGLIYEGLRSTGIKGFGQYSFIWVGEQLQSFTTDASGSAVYQDTAGGWRYVNEAGQKVSYGKTYSGPPLWEYTTFANGLSFGQGPNNDDGLCVRFPDENVTRQVVAGDAHNIKVRRYGDIYIATVVFYSGHQTVVYELTEAELRTMPVLAPAAPPVQPPPVVIPVPPAKVQTMNFPENAKAVVDQFIQQYPVPSGGPNPADDTFENLCRRWCLLLAEQIRFSTSDPNWGVKRADPGRPQSKDSISYNAGPVLWNFDMLTAASTGSPRLVRWPNGDDITGQTFMPVNAINHLNTPSEPPSGPQTGPTAPPVVQPTPDVAALSGQIKELKEILTWTFNRVKTIDANVAAIKTDTVATRADIKTFSEQAKAMLPQLLAALSGSGAAGLLSNLFTKD